MDDYLDYAWHGPEEVIQAIVETYPNVVSPMWVDAEMGLIFGVSPELQVLLETEGPSTFTRVRSATPIEMPRGCAVYSAADADLICGGWAR